MVTIDWVIVGGYFAVLMALTWWVILKNKNTADDYFLAGRNLGWFVIGASIFASNIGSEHLVGLAGSGATDGVAMAHYELHAWCLLILGWVLAPIYMYSNVFTMPEFLEKRFTPSARWLLSLISLIAYVLTKIAVGIFAGGVVFAVLLPEMNFMGMDSFWIGSLLVVILTGLYTVLGGLRAVAYTEALQTFILVIGSGLVTIYGLEALGGWSVLRETLGSDMFNLWKPIVPAGVQGTWAPVMEMDAAGKVVKQAWYFNTNYPWFSMLVCAPVIGLWYWCTDQYIVQRLLGAPNEQQARRGAIFASFLKLLPVFIFIIPGMICFALAKKGYDPEIAKLVGADGKVVRDAAQAAFPLLVKNVMPAGIRGMVVAGLLAALMSSLAGVFNACATLFTMDFYSRMHKGVSQERLVWIGRVATVVMIVIGILWIPVIRGQKGLYDYLQSMQAYLAPPIFVVFFAGVFWKRLNGPGCMAALIIGFLMGIFRLAIDTPVALSQDHSFQYAEGSFFWIMNKVFFQYYSMLIMFVCAAAMFIVSYLTKEPDYDKLAGLTYGTMTRDQVAKTKASWAVSDVIASVVVLVVIIAAYLYFRG